MIIFVWGLPGAGKSTIGRTLSERLETPYYEMDDYLPDTFKEKMRQGELITDEDRDDFFSTFKKVLEEKSRNGDIVVSGYVAKKRHRDALQQVGDLTFFELVVDENTIRDRLKGRGDHFFKEETLQKVLQNVEPLTHAEQINANAPIENVLTQMIEKLN